ncbi:MAG: acetolactate synthase small subunit [Saccharofermentans sp.]|jgi:acetolactate synthase-1/3 small subunit|nr:acetolactate synthase small subunit [Saccharofermentans sp.]
MNKQSYVIAAFVENKSGVLMRVTSMFNRRGFNIDTLTVGETESSEYSRITLTFSGDQDDLQQLVSQLQKLYNVKKVEVISAEVGIRRELLLIKVKNSAQTRSDLRDAVDVFKAKIVDYSAEAMCLEVTGDSTKIDNFIDNMKPFGIIEMCRTGIVALERGSESILSK